MLLNYAIYIDFYVCIAQILRRNRAKRIASSRMFPAGGGAGRSAGFWLTSEHNRRFLLVFSGVGPPGGGCWAENPFPAGVRPGSFPVYHVHGRV
jgi:hypothetical protein